MTQHYKIDHMLKAGYRVFLQLNGFGDYRASAHKTGELLMEELVPISGTNSQWGDSAVAAMQERANEGGRTLWCWASARLDHWLSARNRVTCFYDKHGKVGEKFVTILIKMVGGTPVVQSITGGEDFLESITLAFSS